MIIDGCQEEIEKEGKIKGKMVKKRQNRNSAIQGEFKKIVLKDFKYKMMNIVFLPVLYPNMNCAIMATKEAMIKGNVTIICKYNKKNRNRRVRNAGIEGEIKERQKEKERYKEKEKGRQRERQRRRDRGRDSRRERRDKTRDKKKDKKREMDLR